MAASGTLHNKKFDKVYSVKNYQTGFVIVIFIVAAFGLLDPVLAPVTKFKILAIRFSGILPVLTVCYYLSLRKSLRHYFSWLGVIATLTVIVGTLAIILTAEKTEKITSIYPQAFPIIIGFAGLVFGIAPLHVIAVSISLIVSYNLVFYNRVELHELIAANIFITTAAGLGFYARFSNLRLTKWNFIKTQIIRKDRDDLLKSRKKILESVNINSKLLSIISHDIKGPLASIEGLVKLYNVGAVSRNEITEHFTMLEPLLEGTQSLLSSVTKWSLYHFDNNALNLSFFDLSALIDKAIKVHHLMAELKSNSVQNTISPGTIVYADEGIIFMVMRTLINNANKSINHGIISVDAEQVGEKVKISVTDTRLGISPEDAETIFDWHEATAKRPTVMSAGIELFFSRDFIRHHGSDLKLRSIENLKTTFHFELPGTVRQNEMNTISSSDDDLDSFARVSA